MKKLSEDLLTFQTFVATKFQKFQTFRINFHFSSHFCQSQKVNFSQNSKYFRILLALNCQLFLPSARMVFHGENFNRRQTLPTDRNNLRSTVKTSSSLTAAKFVRGLKFQSFPLRTKSRIVALAIVYRQKTFTLQKIFSAFQFVSRAVVGRVNWVRRESFHLVEEDSVSGQNFWNFRTLVVDVASEKNRNNFIGRETFATCKLQNFVVGRSSRKRKWKFYSARKVCRGVNQFQLSHSTFDKLVGKLSRLLKILRTISRPPQFATCSWQFGTSQTSLKFWKFVEW